jgi:hypothetical protein
MLQSKQRPNARHGMHPYTSMQYVDDMTRNEENNGYNRASNASN